MSTSRHPHQATDGEPLTLPEALRCAATDAPDRGIGLYGLRGLRASRRTWPEVEQMARHGAGRWQALGLRPGDRVLLAAPLSWAWLEAWLGAVLMGAWPAAMPAPTGAHDDERLLELERLFNRLGPAYLLCAGHLHEALETLDQAPDLLSPAGFLQVQPARYATGLDPDPGETAYLQLTSRPSGPPHAVMISHRAAVANARAIDIALGKPGVSRASQQNPRTVAWLALNHEMGLAGCFLNAMLNAVELRLLRPETFYLRPRRWLEALSETGPTFTAAPNSAWQYCVERIPPEERDGLDLSTLQGALNGAEMVRAETCEAFIDAFRAHGVLPHQFRACYGMAEATVAITMDQKGEGVRALPAPSGWGYGLGLFDVACTGQPLLETDVRIAAPDGTPLAEGSVGEIRVRGPGVFNGYYNDRQATQDALKERWFCTGDLGFLHQGELYVMGRQSELLGLGGKKVMPHEIEWLVEQKLGRGARAGAFALEKNGHSLILAVELPAHVESRAANWREDLRAWVADQTSVPLADLVLLKRGRLPKTSSGKINRARLRADYQNRAL
jgi:acyl-CoA synthetase (AMP-forming)/AMP-acid ligase II